MVSIIYLLLSIPKLNVPYSILLRQYAIFGYLACYYILFFTAFKDRETENIVNFLYKLGYWCMGIQLAYISYRLLLGLSVIEGYNYYSPAIVLGLIIASAGALTFVKPTMTKISMYFFLLLLSTTTGHSSTFLSVFVLGSVYILFQTTNRSKLILIAFSVLAVFFLYIFLPQFQDKNAGWRLLTWEKTLNTIMGNAYGFTGEGFGVPYFDKELILTLYNQLGSLGFMGTSKVYEPYISSVHNSFLTIFFSVGLVPGLLIMYPFYKMVLYATRRYSYQSDEADFLFISLIGLSIWVSFNQVLEVPHTTAIFWLVYFSCLIVPLKPINENQL
jgi:hypothetical protein